jgi:hypothetical protein
MTAVPASCLYQFRLGFTSLVLMLFLLVSVPVQVKAQEDFPFFDAPSPWNNPPLGLIPSGELAGQKVTQGTIGQATQVINQPGDIIVVRYVQQFRNPVPLVVRIESDGAGAMTWIGGDDWQGWGCQHWCDWQVTASQANAQFWIGFVGIRGTFGAHLEIVEVKRGSAVSQADKDRAGQLANLYGDSSLWLGSISAALFFIPGQEAGSFAFGVFSVGYGIAQKIQQRIHDDPWDADFQSPYDGAYFDQWTLGLGSCDGTADLGNNFIYYCQDFINQMVQIAFMGDFAYVSANRSNSCILADAGYEDWQRYRAIYGLNRMGDAFANAAGDMWVMRHILKDSGINNDLVGWDIDNFTVYMAQILSDAGSFWQGVQ